MHIGFAPLGALTLRVAVSDGASRRVFDSPFVRVPGQDTLTLVDFRPAVDELGGVLGTIPPSHFSTPGFAPVLRLQLDRVHMSLERALVSHQPGTRAFLVERARVTLRNAIPARADGCSATGQPDGNDWVVDCADQERFSSAAARLLRAVDALR